MDKDRLAQRLMATFIVELEGHVSTLESGLLALERGLALGARLELLGALLRTAHSLKGASRSVKIDLLENASHRLEEVLSAVREGRLAANAAFFNALLPIVDGMADVARRLRAGDSLADAPLARQLPAMKALLSVPPGAIAPTSAMLTTVQPEVAAPRPDAAAAQAKPAAKPAPQPGTGARGETVRVASEKLDNLLRQSSELLVVRHRAEARSEEATRLQDILTEWRGEWRRIEQGVAALLKRDAATADASRAGLDSKQRQLIEIAANRGRDSLWRLDRSLQRFVDDLEADRRAVELVAGPLDATIRQTRMFPFAEACQGLERTVRDLAAKAEKKIALVIEGGEIELDRLVLESIRDPLLHLVRNAVDHGIEPAAGRRAAGKPETGRIAVTAALRGSRVEIQVKDDGRGLDRDAIAARLRAGGQEVPGDPRELALAIFEPGFSTAPAVTEVSGRGVGLDIVKTKLAAMRGTVAVNAAPGGGTVFTLDVPLTLTSVRAVLAGIGDRRFAVDTSSIERVIRIVPAEVRPVGERETVSFAGMPVPVVTLAEALGLPERPPPEAEKIPALVLSSGDRRVALAVDSLDDEREVMVRALGPRLKRLPGIAGGTILADGRIALILNVADLIDRALELPGRQRLAVAADTETVRKRLLVVDDSATIRTLEKSILEAAGYDVIVAVDGEEAWQILLERGADLVVSDVEMPRMDGFSLTEAIRASKRFRDLPVVLVTAMESDADKARGMAVGANAYRPKSAFDQQDLIETIQRIL